MSDLALTLAARAPDLPDIPLFGGVTVGQVFVAVATVVVPATIVGHVLVLWAWARGWEPHRLRNLALVILAAALLAGPIVGTLPWWGVELTGSAVRQAWDGHYLSAGLNSAAATAPLIAFAAWAWWHFYTKRMRSGAAQAAGERHVRRQLRIRAATAARRARTGHTPLAHYGRDGAASVVLGPRYETVRAQPDLLTETLTRRAAPWLELPVPLIALHMACIAETGAGKTTMLVRCSACWMEIAWTAYNQQRHAAAGAARPLVIFLAAKGGPDADSEAREWADAMETLGLSADRVGVFPFETRLNMWRMPAAQLRAALHKLAKTDHRFYDVLQRGLLHLVIDTPTEKPPASSAEFLQRLDPAWLAAAWAGYPVEERALAALTKNTGGGAGASSLDSDLLLFADLFRSIGGDFDAGQPLSDFDALYVSVPGATDQVVAATKTAVLIELLTYELGVRTDAQRQRRQVLFVIDEFSAVSGDTAGDVINLVERLRSMGGSVIVSAQSYEGLADTEDQRRRLLGAMGGGALIGRTTNAEALAEQFGTRLVDEVGYQLDHGRTTGVGTVRRQHTFLLDPNRLRQLPRHHVAYATTDQVIYGVVAPLRRSAAIAGSPRRTAPTSGPTLTRRRLTAGQAVALNRRLRQPGTAPGNDKAGDAPAPDWTGDDWTHDTSNDRDPR